MNTQSKKKTKRTKKTGGWQGMRKLLAWVLCAGLVTGNLCLSENRVKAMEQTETQEAFDEVQKVTSGDGGDERPSLSEDDIAGGTFENITWRIDANGKLTVEGTGEFSDSTDDERAPWHSESGSIKSAEIRVTGLSDASYMFYQCGRLTSVDLSGFDTSSVTYMESMFERCSSLTSLDVSGFDTSNVVDMSSMFSGCSYLTSLDVSGFDTSKVKNMKNMFSDCRSLTSLDVSGFDTSNVRDMRAMFSGCRALTSLDLSGFNTQEVEDREQDESGMSAMFDGCLGIRTLKTFPNLQEEVELPVTMCDEAGTIYQYFPTGLTEGIELRWCNSGSESGVTWTITEDGTLIIAGEKLAGEPDPTGEAWQRYSSKITKVVVAAKNIESTKYWFCDCERIIEIDLSGFDTSKVTDMGHMFDGCRMLTSLDVSGLDTSKVTDMNHMFYDCESLTSLDVSGFDMSKVSDTESMFVGCRNLRTLKTFPNLQQEVGLPFTMCDEAGTVYQYCPTGLAEGISLHWRNGGSESGVTWEIAEDGTLTIAGEKLAGEPDPTGEAWREWDSKITKVIVTAKNIESTKDWFKFCGNITEIDLSGFDTSKVTDMSGMFSYCEGLKSMDVSGFDTSNVSNMSNMFYDCKRLTNLDVSSFDTSKVTDMGDMFYGCDGIRTIKTFPNLQKEVKLPDTMYDETGAAYQYFPTGLAEGISLYWDNSNASGSESGVTWEITKDGILTIAGEKIAGEPDPTGEAWREWASKITKVVVTAKNIESTQEWFRYCENITEIDLSGFDTSKVTDMSEMFWGCSSLTSLDVSGIDTSNVRNMYGMFFECSALTSLDLSGFNTQMVYFPDEDGWSGLDDMFYGCYAIKTIKTFPNLQQNVALPVAMWDETGRGYAYFPTGLTESIYLYSNKNNGSASEDESGVTWELAEDGTLTIAGEKLAGKPDPTGEEWKTHAPQIKKVVVTAKNIESTRYWFEGCENIIEIDLSGFDTSKVTDMEGMFSGCTALETVKTFVNLHQEVALPVTMWDEMGREYDCFPTGLTESIYLYSYNPSVSISGTVSGVTWEITSDGTLTIAGEKLAGEPDPTGEEWREYSFKITKVIVTAKNIESTANWFLDCGNVTKIDLSGFDTGKVTNMAGMFSGCRSLTTLDLSNFDMSGMATVTDMFSGCDSLSTLYAPYNLPYGINTDLPVTGQNDIWQDIDGNRYVKLPVDLDHSIVLARNARPETMEAALSVSMAKTVYITGSELRPENFTVVYRGTDGRSYQLVYDEQGIAGYTLSAVNMNKAGEKTVTVSYFDGERMLTKEVRFRVMDPQPGDLDNPQVPDLSDDGLFHISTVPAQTYTGKAIKPQVIVYCGFTRLKEKTDYTVVYKNNTKVNDATVEKTAPTITVTGKGNYSGKQSVTFVIAPKSIEDEDVEVKELIAAQNGKVQKPVPTLTCNGRTLKNKTDFTVSYPDESKTNAYQNVGTYTVTVSGTGNYTGTKNLTFTIADKTLLSKAKVIVKAKKYTGEAVTLTAEDITVKVGKNTLVYGTDYTLTYRDNLQAGKAVVVVQGIGEHYAGTKETTFQIIGQSIAKAEISGVTDRSYTGDAQTQDIEVRLGGKTLQQGEDYTVSYAKEVNAGTASLIVTGMGGYTGTVKKTFKITPCDLQKAGGLKGIPKNLRVVYAKGGVTPTLTLSFNGKIMEPKKDYTISYSNNKKIGSADGSNAPTITIKGKGNFKGTISVPFTIIKRGLEAGSSVTITAPDTIYVNKPGKYMVKPVLTDANGKKLVAGTDYEKNYTYALVNADGTETALTASDTVALGGIVKVTVTGKECYTGELSATYQIREKSFSKAKIMVKPQIYTGGAVTLKEGDISVTLGGTPLIYGKDYTIVPDSYMNNVRKGTATVTVMGLGEYGGIKTVKFKIATKPLTKLIKY